MSLTYPDVGATQTDDLPAGYRHLRRRVEVGAGPAAFAALADGMRDWGIHRGAGHAVRAPGAPTVGQAFAAGIGVGRLRLWASCQVVWVREESGGYGYGFGTLPGHPARGEPCGLIKEICYIPRPFCGKDLLDQPWGRSSGVWW